MKESKKMRYSYLESQTNLCVNYSPFREAWNSDDVMQHCDDVQLQRQPLRPPMINPFVQYTHFHFPAAIRSPPVSYFPIGHREMLVDCCAMVVAIVVAVVVPVSVIALVAIPSNVRSSGVDCDDAPEIRETNFVGSNVTVVDSNAEYLSALFEIYKRAPRSIICKLMQQKKTENKNPKTATFQREQNKKNRKMITFAHLDLSDYCYCCYY